LARRVLTATYQPQNSIYYHYIGLSVSAKRLNSLRVPLSSVKTKMSEKESGNLYRIFYHNGYEVDELGRVVARDIDQAAEYALNQYFKPDLEISATWGGEDVLFLSIYSCPYCDFYGEREFCENCEIDETIEIRMDNEAEHEFKTIFGTNEYANLITGETRKPFNETLVKAWGKDPQLGALVLMGETLKEKPHLAAGVDDSLKAKIVEAYEAVKNE